MHSMIKLEKPKTVSLKILKIVQTSQETTKKKICVG